MNRKLDSIPGLDGFQVGSSMVTPHSIRVARIWPAPFGLIQSTLMVTVIESISRGRPSASRVIRCGLNRCDVIAQVKFNPIVPIRWKARPFHVHFMSISCPFHVHFMGKSRPVDRYKIIQKWRFYRQGMDWASVIGLRNPNAGPVSTKGSGKRLQNPTSSSFLLFLMRKPRKFKPNNKQQ